VNADDQPERHKPIDTVLAWLGVATDGRARDLLARYGEWLVSEALPAGGIGPGEANDIEGRHVADALTFAVGLGRRPQGSLVDIGSGVGLPGIPLAIVFPRLSVLLVDRSGRRVDLARRAVRVLDLPNVDVVQSDAETLAGGWDYVTLRGVIGLPGAIPLARRLLAPGGTGIIGASRRQRPDSPDDGWGSDVAIVEIPAAVLDSPAWLLTIVA